MKHAKPWYRAQTDSWYVTHAGTQHFLGKQRQRHNTKPTATGTGFVQPLTPHEHWHVDGSDLNIGGTSYSLCSVPGGRSRFITRWEIRETMTEDEIECIIQPARDRFPDATPRIISDNGPPFVAKDFTEFIRICGMTHGRTSPYYPPSTGEIDRFHRTITGDCRRPETPLSLGDARRIVARYAPPYNTVRLPSAIGYGTPVAKLEGRSKAGSKPASTRAIACSKPLGTGGSRTATPDDRPLPTAHPKSSPRSQHATLSPIVDPTFRPAG